MQESARSNSTSAGWSNFDTTHWSVVLQAGKTRSLESSAALETLCRAYWSPLFAFVRRKGYSAEDAEDITQQFFTRLLERNDFEAVDPKKGKFRTFLLTALTHFLSNERDRANALKRGGGKIVVSLEGLDTEQFRRMEPANDISPDKLFDLRWATTVLQQALNRLRVEMTNSGKQPIWDGLKRFLTDDPGEGDYAATAAQLGMTGQAVAVAVHRLRLRYRELVRTEVAQTVPILSCGPVLDSLRFPQTRCMAPVQLCGINYDKSPFHRYDAVRAFGRHGECSCRSGADPGQPAVSRRESLVESESSVRHLPQPGAGD
jgi:RNA polymerase sigma-70 factor (ECF subfamily)